MPELRRQERDYTAWMQRIFFGLRARLANRTRFGRITEVFFDEETGEVSYVVVGRGGELRGAYLSL